MTDYPLVSIETIGIGQINKRLLCIRWVGFIPCLNNFDKHTGSAT